MCVVPATDLNPGAPSKCNTGLALIDIDVYRCPNQVTLTKIWTNAAIGDEATLVISGTGVTNPVPGTSTAPATTIAATAQATTGSTVSLSETLGAGSLAGYTTGSPVKPRLARRWW